MHPINGHIFSAPQKLVRKIFVREKCANINVEFITSWLNATSTCTEFASAALHTNLNRKKRLVGIQTERWIDRIEEKLNVWRV